MVGAEIGADPVREDANVRAHQDMIDKQAYKGQAAEPSCEQSAVGAGVLEIAAVEQTRELRCPGYQVEVAHEDAPAIGRARGCLRGDRELLFLQRGAIAERSRGMQGDDPETAAPGPLVADIGRE